MDVDVNTAEDASVAVAPTHQDIEEQGAASEPAAEASSVPISSSPPAAKKARGRNSHRSDGGPKICYIVRMPLEILAEILSHTPSPGDVLAVARCSKFFCATLVNNPSTNFIWRHARARSTPDPVPDPIPCFTEASYAAFVFDGGECEHCKKKTRLSFHSFMLRLRTCGKSSCAASAFMIKCVSVPLDVPRYKDITAWIPRAEPYLKEREIGGTGISVRISDWNAAVNEFNKAALTDATMQEYVRKKQIVADRMPAVIEHAEQLLKWKNKRELRAAKVKEANERKMTDFAKREGWKIWDLKTSEVYSLLHRSKTASFEYVTEKDFSSMRSTIAKEVSNNNERRIRREAEQAYRTRREEVAKHYKRLKAARYKQVLPTLPEFRKLSVMRVMQSKGSPDVVKDLKKSKLVAELLDDNLAKWRDDARAALAGALGFPGWRAASKTKLHPVDRLTARFRCKKCASVLKKPAEDRAMNFAAVCEHRCMHLTKKQRAREAWQADQFEPDQQAIDVVTQVLTLAGADPEKVESLSTAQSIWGRVQCLSCAPAIVMDLENAIRHSRRHEEVKFTVLSKDEATAISQNPYQTGMTARLMRDPSGVAARDKAFGCRHCHQVRASDSTVASAAELLLPLEEGEISTSGSEPHARETNERAATSGPVDHRPLEQGEIGASREDHDARMVRKPAEKKMFTFNGLRSHVKTKHTVLNIADEDFFRLAPRPGM